MVDRADGDDPAAGPDGHLPARCHGTGAAAVESDALSKRAAARAHRHVARLDCFCFLQSQVGGRAERGVRAPQCVARARDAEERTGLHRQHRDAAVVAGLAQPGKQNMVDPDRWRRGRGVPGLLAQLHLSHGDGLRLYSAADAVAYAARATRYMPYLVGVFVVALVVYSLAVLNLVPG